MDYNEKKYFVKKIQGIAENLLEEIVSQKEETAKKMHLENGKIILSHFLKNKDKVWDNLKELKSVGDCQVVFPEKGKYKYMTSNIRIHIQTEIFGRELEEEINKNLEKFNQEFEFFKGEMQTVYAKKEEICDRIMAGEEVWDFKKLAEEMDLCTL